MERVEIIKNLKKTIETVHEGARGYIEFYLNKVPSGSNQMLFFIKPELTAIKEGFEEIAGFIFERVESYGLQIEDGFVISGGLIEEENLIAGHYGIIDAASRAPANVFTEEMWHNFEEAFDSKREDAKVYGSIEYLAQHRDMSADQMSSDWLQSDYKKLGSGVYCRRMDDDVFLVNGFYPRLLRHFTKPGSCIACFILKGDTPWRVARSELVGATAPEKAAPGSIRNSLLERKDEFGLQEVSPNANGVHLSAGPVEGAVEILRFSQRHNGLEDLVFGRMMKKHFSSEQIEAILSNESVKTESGEQSFFDLTEELDSDEAITAIKRVVR